MDQDEARNKKEDVPALSENNFRDNLEAGNINFFKKQFINKWKIYLVIMHYHYLNIKINF